MTREPRWLEWARGQVGTKEFPGAADNPAIIKYFKLAGLSGKPFTDDETPWCAAFVGAALAAIGMTGTHSAAARSYATWEGGKRLQLPVLGAIAVLHRNPPKPSLGHVGFVVGADETFVALLGGNQSDSVCVQKFARSRVICWQWPKNELIAAEWMNPPLSQNVQIGGRVV
jgi:uncharacterized protein (TIGR02594 family)